MRKSFFDPKLLLKFASKFYFIAKEAASLSEIIETMNLDPEILEFLDTIPNDKKGFYVAELRKNPNMDLTKLKNLKLKEKVKPEILPEEIEIVKNLPNQYKEWALIQLRKLRGNTIPPTNVYDYIIFGKGEEWENLGKFQDYAFVATRFTEPQIVDWMEIEQPQIASYTAKEAIKAQAEWHKEMSKKGAKQKYKEGAENIVYGPNWENPKFNGWTIRKIMTKNDLEVEGHKMNHCVGSYCEYVDLGQTTIYSLRDPSNNPHVTLEAEGNSYRFEQIQGHSNSDPKPEYKEMIKEWFQKLKKSGKNVTYNENMFNVDSLSSDWNTAKSQLQIVTKENKYGTKSDLTSGIRGMFIFTKFLSYAMHNEEESEQIAIELAKLIHTKDKNLYNLLKDRNINKKNWWDSNCGIASVIDFYEEKQDQFEFLKQNNEPEYIKENIFPFNFIYPLIMELKKINSTDPIPTEEWMGIYNYDYLSK